MLNLTAIYAGRIVIGLVLVAITIYCLIAFVVAPEMRQGDQITLLQGSTPKSKPPVKILPTTKGDLVLTGELRKAGRVLPNGSLVFLFQDSFRTQEIITDAAGRFQFRLPPGQWRFLGPLVRGSESEEIKFYFIPEKGTATPTFDVGVSTTDKIVDMKIFIGSTGIRDL